MIRYAVYNSPLGKLFVMSIEQGIYRVTFDRSNIRGNKVRDLLPGLGNSFSSYFRGYKEIFDYPVDLSSLPGFSQQVLMQTKKIPYGKTRTYKELACMMGKENTQRAVGQALKRNPLPIIIPCHRVVRDKNMGGYSLGLGVKLWLLLLEKAGIFNELTSTVERLRRECPWDRVQTHKTLLPYLEEECKEVVKSIEKKDGLSEELGDLLLQVLMHSEIAGEFDIIDVCGILTEKLKLRHPHIFAGRKATTPEDVTKIWEEVKRNN